MIVWDVSFVLFRPSFFLWAPYDRYVTVDLGYGNPDGFVRAQAIMSLLEVAMVLVGLALRRRAAGVLLVFGASLLTSAKTILIFLIEVVTGGQHVGHNPPGDLVLLYILPNALWVVVPLIVAWKSASLLSIGGPLACRPDEPPDRSSK